MLKNKLYWRAQKWVDNNQNHQCWGVVYRTTPFPLLPFCMALGSLYVLLYHTTVCNTLYVWLVEALNCRPDSEPVVFFNGINMHWNFTLGEHAIKRHYISLFINFVYFKIGFLVMMFFLWWQFCEFLFTVWRRRLVALQQWMDRHDLFPGKEHNKYWYRNWGNNQRLIYIEVPCRGDARYLSYELANYFLQYRAYHPKGKKFYDNLSEQVMEPWFADRVQEYGGEFQWWLWQINQYGLVHQHISRETVILRNDFCDKYYYRGRHVFTVNNILGTVVLYHNSSKPGEIGYFSVGNL